MADNLIFPIGFDLEKGVRDVIAKGDIYIRQIEHAMNRKPIVLRAEVDASKFQLFSRQFTNSIDGISAKLAQAQRLWNAMTFDVKVDADGNLSRRAQVVFDAFQQLTQASATMGQRLGEVNRNLAKSEQDTARAITAEYDKRRQQTNEHIRLKERQAAAEERVRQSQLKGVNVGYTDTQKQVEAVRNLRLQYEAILPMLNAMAQRRYDIKVGIDKQFEVDIQRINAEIARLRQSNLQLGAKGDTNAIQANLQAIRQLEAELQRISQQKIDLLNSNKINSDLARLRTEISSVFGELQSAERRLATDNSLNAALDAQSQKVLKLHADIQKLDQQFAQLNAMGKAYNQDGSFTTQANTLLQQRIALTKQLEQEAITGQQAQIKLEQQLREEKRQTEQAAKNAAKEAERQAKAEAVARKQAQDAANAENKARQEAYNARRRQGQETQRILNKEAKSIADITAKLQIQQQRLQSTDMNSKKFSKIAEEVRRLTADLEKANQKMRELTGQSQSGAARQSAAMKRVSQEFKNQETYVSRLIKRMAVYTSFSMVGNFLAKIREVTAEFELQRVSLGAIIQDQAKANMLFSEIKAFALKSPVSILDLTKYTKQLAAYKVGWNGVTTDVKELFDWTKRLTDVSVGIGTSMDRVVLAFGQVRATGYLRASEVRQFTEMGIPIVEELAAKLSKLNGEAVTAAEVMDMISKRGISFEMVKDVFDDMTSAGGMFYNMQEKQGNTLYGLWAKLGDAASVMYDEIGNTGFVAFSMRALIGTLRSLMLNWKEAGAMLGTLGIAILLYVKRVKVAELATKANNAATAAGSAFIRRRIAHLQRAITLQDAFTTSTTASTRATKIFTLAQLKLAKAANLVVVGFQKLKAAFIGNIWGLALTGLMLLIEHLVLAKDEAKELQNTLADNNADYERKRRQDAANLEHLANAAINAAKGSKAQKDALNELVNTYGKIIPAEMLTIENLERMKGDYSELIDLIDEYNLKQKYEKDLSDIESSFGTKKQERAGKIRNTLRDGLTVYYKDENRRSMKAYVEFSEQNIQNFLSNLDKYAEQGLEKKEIIERASADLAKELNLDEKETAILTKGMLNLDRHFFEGQGTLMDYTEALRQEKDSIEATTDAYNEKVKALNKYSAVVDEVMHNVQNAGEVSLFKNEFGNETARTNNQIADIVGGINTLFEEANVAIDEGTQKIMGNALKGSTVLYDMFPEFFDSINAAMHGGTKELLDSASAELGMLPATVWDTLEKAAEAANNPKLLAAIKNLRKQYLAIAPDNETTNFVRNGLVGIVSAADVSMQKYRQYLYDGSKTIKEYEKDLNGSITTLRDQAFEMIKVNSLIDAGLVKGQKYDDATIKELQERADLLQKYLTQVVHPLVRPDDNGHTSDPRLQNLQEIANKMAEVNKEYDELLKKEGQTKALADTQKLFASSFKQMEATAKKYGFKLPAFEVPQTIEDVQKWYKAVANEIKRLGLKNADKVLIELGFKSDKAAIDKQQKEIEKQLKELSDRISRTKTAKEFYEKILGMTGNNDMAARLVTGIFGENGDALNKEIARRLRTMVSETSAVLSDGVFNPDMSVNAKSLRAWARANKKLLGDNVYKELAKFAADAEKDTSKLVEGWLSATKKAQSYGDKLAEVYRKTAAEIARIDNQMAVGNIGREDGEKMKENFRLKEAEEIAKLQYEAFKDSPMYVQVFDDLDNASTRMLNNMKNQLQGLQGQWKNLDPTQLKELQGRMREIDKQLARRNPFKVMADSLKEYRRLRTQGDSRGNKSRAKADRDVADWSAKRLAAEKELARVMADPTSTQAQIAGAKRMVDYTKEEEEEARKAAENWKKVVDAIGLSANELFQMLNWAGDIAKGIADISEAMGADEEDVQYWNDVADALGQISGGIQDIVSAAMSGNVVGIISSVITAIPKMFVGFANLFSAGKIKRANKEIRRQKELLEQLEYTYGRLEKAADKVFGRDYLNNYNRQLKNLQAQQSAYEKQAKAERSKGKKEDKEKTKEYLNNARDVADQIKDLQGELAAHFTGQSLTDAAKQMAQSWIEARSSMSDTFAAIKEDYKEMIRNMIVEGAAARVIENALTPMWDSMEKMLADNDMDGAIDAMINGMDSALNAANNGMEVLWKALEARGYDMKQLIGDTDSEYTGIAKNVAGASSEEILQLSGFVNTALYYVSPIPRIDENLARVVALMEGGSAVTTTSNATGWTDWQQQAMDNYQAIARNTAETVIRCERAAVACEKMAGAITAKGPVKGLNVFMH